MKYQIITKYTKEIFLLFYLINKETRSDFHKLFLGVLVTISLSYAMTRGAYLLQTLSIVLYLQFILMVFYQEIDLLPDWKIPIIFIAITSFSSIFLFNLHMYVILAGVVSALIISTV